MRHCKIMSSFMHYLLGKFTLMHDNASPHATRIVRKYLNEVDITQILWPAHTPDLNPIEHVWDRLDRSIRSQVPTSLTIDPLRIVLLKKCKVIPIQFYSNPKSIVKS